MGRVARSKARTFSYFIKALDVADNTVIAMGLSSNFFPDLRFQVFRK